MACRSIILSGNCGKVNKFRIQSAEANIQNGKWLISLQSVLVKGVNSSKSFSFSVTCNLVESSFLDSQNRHLTKQTTLGLFAVKDLGENEHCVLSNGSSWFEINCPLSEMVVNIREPFSGTDLTVENDFVFYFVYREAWTKL